MGLKEHRVFKGNLCKVPKDLNQLRVLKVCKDKLYRALREYRVFRVYREFRV
jgi:hypothetical protein